VNSGVQGHANACRELTRSISGNAFLKIAQRFNAGWTARMASSPAGAKETWNGRFPCSAVPVGTGESALPPHPALKRWAILESPFGTEMVGAFPNGIRAIAGIDVEGCPRPRVWVSAPARKTAQAAREPLSAPPADFVLKPLGTAADGKSMTLRGNIRVDWQCAGPVPACARPLAGVANALTSNSPVPLSFSTTKPH
jgi:hypothetical protein